jgi:DNA-binding LacI/PurR family transcriptional regulator
MAATIHDVAQLAQVAISTVSKVMSDSPRISAETKLRVRNAMLTLDYHPSRNARGLAKNTTETLGILMPLERDCAFRNPYVFEILCGIESLCSQHSYSVTLLNAMQLANNRNAIKRLIAERQVDGFILHATQDAPLLIKLLSEQQLPFVVIGQLTPHDKHSWVDMDNVHAGQTATRHLLEQGYRRLQFVGSQLEDTISRKRALGFLQALNEQELAPVAADLYAGESSSANGRAIWQQIARQAQRPDAIVIATSQLAAGLMSEAQASGIRIGPDLGVISFDNYPLAEHTSPALSVIDLDLFELGAQASRALFEQLNNPQHRIQSQLLNLVLRARASSQR